jgi:hypothetical protein
MVLSLTNGKFKAGGLDFEAGSFDGHARTFGARSP